MGMMEFIYAIVVILSIIGIFGVCLVFVTQDERHNLSGVIKTWTFPAVVMVAVFCLTFSLAKDVKSKQGTFELENSRVTVYSDNDMFTYTVDKNTGLIRGAGKTVPEFTQLLIDKGFTERK